MNKIEVIVHGSSNGASNVIGMVIADALTQAGIANVAFHNSQHDTETLESLFAKIKNGELDHMISNTRVNVRSAALCRTAVAAANDQ